MAIKSNAMVRIEDLVDVIERMKEEERKCCDDFCNLNSGAANDQRRRDCTLICASLNGVLYELGALNFVY